MRARRSGWIGVVGLSMTAMLLPATALAQDGVTRNGWTEWPFATADRVEILLTTPAVVRRVCSNIRFSFYWDIPTSQQITPAQEQELLDRHIVPGMRTECPGKNDWELFHFIKGKPLLDEKGQEIAFSGRTYVAHEGRWLAGTTPIGGRARAPYASYDEASAGLRDNQRAVEASRRDGEEQRAAQLADEARRRTAKCTAESAGGTQPCGLVLAEEFVERAKLRMPDCPKVLEHAWCTVDYGRTWVRWMGGTKHGCTRSTTPAGWLCDFNVDWECKVRDMRTNEEVTTPAVVGPLCLVFAPVPLRARAAPAGLGWDVELVSRTARP